jgi:four helix bundle protein
MKENNIIQQKSFRFGVDVIGICKVLKEKKKETVMSNQLLQAGTSVGANIEEGPGCQSKKDIYFRLAIAYK